MTGETCRGCGCTDHHACPGGCYWVDPGICSTCFTRELDGRMAGKVVPWVDARTAVDEAFSAGLSSENFDMQPLISSAVFNVTAPTMADLQMWLDCAPYRRTRPTTWADLQIAAPLNIRIEAACIGIEAQSPGPQHD